MSRIYDKKFLIALFLPYFEPFLVQLDPRAKKCIFIVYALTKKGYKCFNPKTKFHVSMDVYLLENKPYFQKNYLQGEKEGVEDNF